MYQTRCLNNLSVILSILVENKTAIKTATKTDNGDERLSPIPLFQGYNQEQYLAKNHEFIGMLLNKSYSLVFRRQCLGFYSCQLDLNHYFRTLVPIEWHGSKTVSSNSRGVRVHINSVSSDFSKKGM